MKLTGKVKKRYW